ncbi:MAG: glycosyltransferase family 61 protein [Lacunisphaera sp.]
MKAGDYIMPPVACASLAHVVTICGGSIIDQGERRSIKCPLPAHAAAEVQDFLRAQTTTEATSRCLARLPGGRVFGSGNVLSPDGKWLARDVSPDFGKPFPEHWLLSYKKIPPPRRLSGKTAVIATTLGSGYSHWLLEELPRLLALAAGDFETIIAHANAPCQREAIALHGFSETLIDPTRRDHYSCDELIVPSLGDLTPETIARLNGFIAPLRASAATSSFGERLYVSRAIAKRRRVLNESELWSALEPRGFVKLQLEELTWSEQIAAFRGAKMIVTPHGAGLANLVFCEPGTKVVELFNRSYVNPGYWQLAALQALDYWPLVSAGPEPLAQHLAANRLDLTADTAQVMAALDA